MSSIFHSSAQGSRQGTNHSACSFGYSSRFALALFVVCVVCAVVAPNITVAQQYVANVSLRGIDGRAKVMCDPGGVCSVSEIAAAKQTTAVKLAKVSNVVYVQGAVSITRGALVFVPHAVTGKNLKLRQVTELPFHSTMTIGSEIARNLGFSGVTIERGVYPVDETGVAQLRAGFSVGLSSHYNPATSSAVISFEILRPSTVSVSIINSAGERVATLLDRAQMTAQSAPLEYLWKGITAGGTTSSGAGLSGNNAERLYAEVRVSLPEGLTFSETVPVQMSIPTPLAQK